MTDEELIYIYNNEDGSKFAKADDYVKTLVPPVIMKDGLEFHHFSVHYKASEKLFAYFNATIETKFIYLTQKQAVSFKPLN